MPHINAFRAGAHEARQSFAAAVVAHPRVLFLAYDPHPPTPPTRFHCLSAELSGAVVAPAPAGAVSRNHPIEPGRFQYIEFNSSPRRWRLLGALLDVYGYLRSVQRLLAAGERYDVIVAVGLFKTAVAGVLVKRLIGTPLIIELPIVPRKVVLFRSRRRGLRTRIRAFMWERAAAALLGRADHLKEIFPDQVIQVSRRLARKPRSTFPDFTPVGTVQASAKEDYLLLIGTPLYLKGADVAIRAFKKLLPEFRAERLLIVGSAAGFADLEHLIEPGDPIELIDYVPHARALEHIRSAKILLIPSRTDAMPRVAVEGMAAGKAIVASRVDGMPAYLRHGDTALLCAAEDHDDLALQIRKLLLNPKLRERLGANARETAIREFGEHPYVSRYNAMVRSCAGRR